MARTQGGETAKTLLSRGQSIVLGVLAVLVVAGVVLMPLQQFLKLLLALIITFYCLFVGMKLFISWAGARFKFPEVELPSRNDLNLPTYTVLVPLYGETAVLPKLVEALNKLQYPKAKLQILLLLEADDQPMIEAVDGMDLPRTFEWVLVPPSEPRTKPKAMNVAMGLRWLDGKTEWDMPRATGKFLTIFDAEDLPEPDELLKAVASMRQAQKADPRVVCMQAILQFWNPRSGAPSPFYWAEYVVHFRWMLTGMARLGLIPPLGGTSNHFEVFALRKVAERYGEVVLTDMGGNRFAIPSVWDPYNVTEDADLAGRLARFGYRIGVMSALTLEEAPNRLKVAKKQRTRWLKGYWQTALVQLRCPMESMKEMGPGRYLAYNFFLIGTPLSIVLNPLMWSLTLLYLVSRWTEWEAATLYIEGLFPPGVYYAGMLVAVIGNLFFSYQKLATPLARGEYGLGKYLLLTPLWWMFTSLSGYKALYELIVPSKRSSWAKTEHGHDQAMVPGATEQSQIAAATLSSGNGHAAPGTQPASQPVTRRQQ